MPRAAAKAVESARDENTNATSTAGGRGCVSVRMAKAKCLGARAVRISIELGGAARGVERIKLTSKCRTRAAARVRHTNGGGGEGDGVAVGVAVADAVTGGVAVADAVTGVAVADAVTGKGAAVENAAASRAKSGGAGRDGEGAAR